MSTMDIFGMTDKLDEPILGVLVNRLEARGKHPFFLKMLQDYLDAMEIDSAKTVLDMGCGTGLAARKIALREGFSGKVVGFPYILAEVGKAEFWASGIDSYFRLVIKSGMMTEEYMKDWAAGLVKDSEEGIFFGASNYYGYVAEKIAG